MDGFYLICAYVLSAVLGLCVGSFLNVVIYRLPLNMSLSKPNSHCTHCGYELRWYDNIPLLSYVMLGGRCRKCKKHISLRYTVVELVNMILWLLTAYLFIEKSIPLACIYMIALSVFICIFFIDLEHKIIFDRFQIILLLLGMLSIIFDRDYGWLSHVIGGVGGFLVFYLISLAYEKLCHLEGLGGGDVKLAGVVGLLLGWEKLLFGLVAATIPAAVILLILSRGKEGENRQFPFAPFLTIGFAVSMLFGRQIIEWYVSLFGL